MMAPHWLDHVFQAHMSADQAATAIMTSQRFREAVILAQVAFRESEKHHKEFPDLIGASPAQQARVAFLDSLSKN